MKQSHHEHLQRIASSFGVDDLSGAELSRLIRLLSTGYETIFKARMKEESLSGPRWRILLQLYLAEEMGMPGVSPSKLAQARNVSKNTVSTLLRSLEERALVTRAISSSDRRSFVIHLSEKGRQLVRERSPQHLELLNELSGNLSLQERAQLVALLRKLYKSLIQHGGLPESYCRSDES
jgi:DNA-binding MarR family transcriptional regulator